jgi:hypothetical protein
MNLLHEFNTYRERKYGAWHGISFGYYSLTYGIYGYVPHGTLKMAKKMAGCSVDGIRSVDAAADVKNVAFMRLEASSRIPAVDPCFVLSSVVNRCVRGKRRGGTASYPCSHESEVGGPDYLI